MIQRYEDTYDGMDLSDAGYWVAYEDHLAEIAKKDKMIFELKTQVNRFNYTKKLKPLEPTYIDCRGNGGMYTAPPLKGNEEPLQIQEPEE